MPTKIAFLIPKVKAELTNNRSSRIRCCSRLSQSHKHHLARYKTHLSNKRKSLAQPFPFSSPQPPNTTLPPSAPLYPLPPILPTGCGQANNYPSPMILSQYPYVYNLSSINIAGEVLNQAPVTARSVKISSNIL